MLTLKNNFSCFVICFFLATPLLADTTVNASIKLLNFNYEEFDQSGASFNKETGFIPGLSLSLSEAIGQLTNTVGFESYDGQVNYDGQTQSGVPHVTDTEETLLRLFYKASYLFKDSDSSIYGKLAWQQWDRNILPANNVSGLYEQYQWWTYELGMQTMLHENHTDTWQLELGLSKINNGSIEIDLKPFGLGQPELDLGDGTGATVALIYQHKLTSGNTIGFSLQHQRWTFGRSNTRSISDGFTSYDITEPRSVSSHSSVSFNYGYYF